jgi:predicted Fe-S protein YdhL (DUF1289 family)
MAIAALKLGGLFGRRINFCEIDEHRRECLSCHCTVGAMMHLAQSTPRKKRAVLAKLPARRAAR